MAKRPIPTTADMQAAIKKIDPNISCEVIDPRDLLVAGGVSMGLWVYNGVTGGYQLTVRDKANNEWKSFDVGDNANCLEDAAKCFVDFYNAKHKSESHKFNCSMQKKKESLANKKMESTSYDEVRAFVEQTGCLDAIADCLTKMCMYAKDNAINKGLHSLQGNHIYTTYLNDVLENAFVSDYNSSIEEHITDCISDFVKQEVPPKSN